MFAFFILRKLWSKQICSLSVHFNIIAIVYLEQYSALTDETELKLNEADRVAEWTTDRYSHEEVFGRVRERKNGREKI